MAGPTNPLLNFTEQRFTHFNHQIRVFVCGVDVSSWLKGNVSVTYGDRESFNTCSFEISNPRKIWQITPANLQGDFGGSGEYDQGAKANVFAFKNDLTRNPFFSLDITLTQLGKQDVTRPSVGSTLPAGTLAAKQSFYPPTPLEERRWRLALYDCIFNKNDPMRIFMKNPLNNNKDQWMEVFCGFVQDIQITTNRVNGESSIRMTGSCIKQQLNKMRVNTNPFSNMVNLDPAPLLNKGFYKDFIKAGEGTHPFATSSLEQTIKILICGTANDAAAAGDFDTKNNKQSVGQRVGGFTLGNIVCYDPGAPGNTLETWHLMTMFGVNKVTYPKGDGSDDLWLTNSEVNLIGQNTRQDIDRVVGGPDARYLHFLLPKGGTGPGALIESDVVKSAGSGTREFTTRWEIIRDFTSKLDFQVLTSPSGDILVEFPQYGFIPQAYAPRDRPIDQTANVGRLFVFDIHQKEDTMADEAEDFPTILQVSGGFAQQSLNSGTADASIVGVAPRAYVYSPALVSRYGVISESADFPFAGQGSDDIKASLIRRLGQLGLIEYTKRLANASSWSGSLVFRPFIFPNRPIELIKNQRCGLVKSASLQWAVGQSASMDVSCQMLMAKRNDGTYRLLTGSVNTPIDYSSIWGSDDETGQFHQQTSGVYAQVSEQQTNPQPEGQPNGVSDAPKTKAVVTVTYKDLDLLYPPFKELIQQLLAECQRQGVDAYPSQTYRTPEQQNAVLAQGFSNAEAFLSYHQYGLACDIAVRRDGKYISNGSDPLYTQLGTINDQLKLGMTWGGIWTKPFDPGHFQIPASWNMNARKARAIREAEVGKPEAQAIKAVWNTIDQQNPGLNTQSEAVPDVSGTAGSAGAAAQASVGTFGVLQSQVNSSGQTVQTVVPSSQAGGSLDTAATAPIPPAKACEPRTLQAPGLKK